MLVLLAAAEGQHASADVGAGRGVGVQVGHGGDRYTQRLGARSEQPAHRLWQRAQRGHGQQRQLHDDQLAALDGHGGRDGPPDDGVHEVSDEPRTPVRRCGRREQRRPVRRCRVQPGHG